MYGEENEKGFGKNPNMIWIFADQLRAQALGCNRDKNVHTPNIDMLSQTGILWKERCQVCRYVAL